MKLHLLYKAIYLSIIFIVTSCAGSSEIINMSSRNISKDEIKITLSGSLNPTVMPLCHENVDTIANTSYRLYGNYPLPMNPAVSLNALYGLTNFYETGTGVDISLIGFTLILNNKIGFSDFKNHNVKKRTGFSYYNKTSFTKGFAGITGDYSPYKKGHFEVGNYFLMGFFKDDYEFIISPHIDYNFLMSRKYEHYSINDGKINEHCNGNKGLKSEIINHNLSFINYGVNLSLRTKNNFNYEIGFQYSDLNTTLYEPHFKSNFQFSLGVGYELSFK